MGGTDPNTKYKLIIEPAQTWDGDTPGTAVSFGEKIPGTSYWVPGIHIPCNSLGYKAPNGTTPHESGHNWQNEGGLPPTKPQGLTESLANWVMQLHLGAYPKDWPVVGMPMGHAVVGYNCQGVNERVTPEVDGLLVPMGDDLAPALARLCADIHLRRRMGAFARAKAERQDWKPIFDELEQRYLQLTQGKEESKAA
jgi:hypothetical protein